MVESFRLMSPEEEAYEKWLIEKEGEQGEDAWSDSLELTVNSAEEDLPIDDLEESEAWLIDELFEENTILSFCREFGISYVRFTSNSKGRGGKGGKIVRKRPVGVELVIINGKGRRLQPGDFTKSNIPLDKIAQEVLPQSIYDTFGSNPGEKLLAALREGRL